MSGYSPALDNEDLGRTDRGADVRFFTGHQLQKRWMTNHRLACSQARVSDEQGSQLVDLTRKDCQGRRPELLIHEQTRSASMEPEAPRATSRDCWSTAGFATMVGCGCLRESLALWGIMGMVRFVSAAWQFALG